MLFFGLDKNQHLSEFLQLIKTSSDLQPLFESVQNASASNTEVNPSGLPSNTGNENDSPRHMV